MKRKMGKEGKRKGKGRGKRKDRGGEEKKTNTLLVLILFEVV